MVFSHQLEQLQDQSEYWMGLLGSLVAWAGPRQCPSTVWGRETTPHAFLEVLRAMAVVYHWLEEE